MPNTHKHITSEQVAQAVASHEDAYPYALDLAFAALQGGQQAASVGVGGPGSEQATLRYLEHALLDALHRLDKPSAAGR